MSTNLFDPKSVQYYSGETLLKESLIIRSKNLSNEFLGMMLGSFYKKDSYAFPQIVEIEDINEFEDLQDLLMYQLSNKTNITECESSAVLGNQKLLVLYVPEECNKLVFKPDNIELIIEDSTELKVNNLVILSIGSTKLTDPSVLIHENSDYPHSELSTKVLTLIDFEKLLNLPEIDLLKSTKSLTILGDRQVSILTE